MLGDPQSAPSREERFPLRLVAEGTPTPGRRGKRLRLVAVDTPTHGPDQSHGKPGR